MPQETKVKAEFGSASGTGAGNAPSLAGWTVDVGDAAMTMDVLEKAFDYRGDVTLRLADGRVVGGYLFDRRKGAGLADSQVRVMPEGGGKVTVAYGEIRRVEFSARDPAAGKSFETWVKKYVEKKMKGERASIESEEGC